MKTESPWIVGRQAIGDYAGVSTWTVTAMIKAGLRCCGGKKNGCEPKSKAEWIDEFIENNPDFIARDYFKKKEGSALKIS